MVSKLVERCHIANMGCTQGWGFFGNILWNVSPYFCCMDNSTMPAEAKLSFDKFREEVLNDYKVACISREASLLGRKEVLTGKAKFGIFGDGKE